MTVPALKAAAMINDDSFYADVGKLIRNARKTRKMTQEGLGKAVSLTRTSITNIERGRQKLLLHTLAKIADVLGVAIAQLVPETNVDADAVLVRVLKTRPNVREREWIRTSVLSAAQKGNKP
jgi:transcriptional regulator with XRE-family HTH domain